MEHQLVVVDDAEQLAVRAAAFVVQHAEGAISDHGRFRFAVSGGRTPWAMFEQLTSQNLEWRSIELYQVDERVAPDDDPERNLANLHRALGSAPASIVAMPVTDPDIEHGAHEYAARLPGRFDLVHLGLGPDGHTASLVPGDPVLEVTDRLVAVTAQPYQGHRRMTLTYPALARGDELVWLVSGDDKREALARLLSGDRSIPAGRVEASMSTVIADAASAGGL